MIDDTYEEHYDSPKPDKSYYGPTTDDGVRCVVRVRRKEVHDDGYWNDWEGGGLCKRKSIRAAR